MQFVQSENQPDSSAIVQTIIQVESCVNNEDCLSETVISNLIEELNVETLFINALFNPQNLNRPVGYYFDSQLNEELVKDLSKEVTVSVRS